MAISITFAESIENHVGMQRIESGCMGGGWTYEDLLDIKNRIRSPSYIYQLNGLIREPDPSIEIDNAAILIIRDFVGGCCDLDQSSIYEELQRLDWDKKALIRGRVVNKKARWNLCFADTPQSPDYDKGMGRVYDINKTPLNSIRNTIYNLVGHKLFAEGNYYYNNKCYIGFHGDGERKCVFGVNFAPNNTLRYLNYQWYYNCNSVSDVLKILLRPGDAYIMSEKATGNDWRKKSIYTLRHSATFD